MEQPRPLRRRRRSSRRGAGPPAVPSGELPGSGGAQALVPGSDRARADAAGGAGIPLAEPPASGTAPAGPLPADAAARQLSPVTTPPRQPSGQGQPIPATAVANASFDSPAEFDPSHPDGAGHEAAHTFAGSPGSAAGHPPEHARPSGEGPRRSYRTPREDQSERSLRALVTTRSTQVSPTAAMRAREVAVPAAEDLLAAERDLVLVRRHYVPPTALAAGRRRERTERRPAASGQSGGAHPAAGGDAPSEGARPAHQ